MPVVVSIGTYTLAFTLIQLAESLEVVKTQATRVSQRCFGWFSDLVVNLRNALKLTKRHGEKPGDEEASDVDPH